MIFRVLLLSAVFMLSTSVKAEEINIQLSDDTARIMYLTEAFGQNFGRLELETGFLYNKGGDSLVNVGLLVRGESVSVPLIVSMGARLYYAEIGTSTVGAMTIGGDLLLQPESWGGLGLGAFFFTAPSVVSFFDAEDLKEYGVYLSFQISPQASIVGGFQHIDAGIENVGTVDIIDGGYFALNISF